MTERDPEIPQMFRSKVPVSLGVYSEKERNALLEKAASRALDPTVFDDDDLKPFLFRVNASNQNVDSYFTRMREDSLQNYAADAEAGVSFQVNHNTGGFLDSGDVGFGRSIQGSVNGPKNNRVFTADFYTVPGLVCGSMTSDRFITGARTGIYHDVSIGFMPGEMICNICGNDFLRRWSVENDEERCHHWPGDVYTVGEGRSKKEVQCVLDVGKARLNEVSIVYDGATPGAGIVAVDMARYASSHGLLGESERTRLENMWGVRIAPHQGIYVVGDMDMTGRKVAAPVADPEVPEGEAATAAAETRAKTVINLTQKKSESESSSEPMERLRAKYEARGIVLSDDPFEAVETLGDALVAQADRIESLEREAQDGREFRQSLVTELRAEVVRAYGNEGDVEARQNRHEKMTRGMSVTEIREHIADLQEIASERLKGGRQTRDITEETQSPSETPAQKRRRAGRVTPNDY